MRHNPTDPTVARLLKHICFYFNKRLQQGRLCLISEKNGLLVVALILVWNLKYYQAMFWLSTVVTHLDLYLTTNLNEYRYVTGKTLPDKKFSRFGFKSVHCQWRNVWTPKTTWILYWPRNISEFLPHSDWDVYLNYHSISLTLNE